MFIFSLRACAIAQRYSKKCQRDQFIDKDYTYVEDVILKREFTVLIVFLFSLYTRADVHSNELKIDDNIGASQKHVRRMRKHTETRT